jgi:predicted nucleotidyltransferase
MHGLESFDKEAKHAVTVVLDGVRVRVLPLERIIASKTATNRPKDRAILPVLEDAARTLRARRRKR